LRLLAVLVVFLVVLPVLLAMPQEEQVYLYIYWAVLLVITTTSINIEIILKFIIYSSLNFSFLKYYKKLP